MHLFIRLRDNFDVSIVPGVIGMSGAWGGAAAPMTWGDDVLVVLPATLPLDELERRLALADAAVIMKIGRNFAARQGGAHRGGHAERAIYVERATMAGEVVTPLCRRRTTRRLISRSFSRRGGEAAVTGRVMIVGLGPGPAEWMTPEASAAIEEASDVVGYGPYLRAARLAAGPARARERQSRRNGPRAPCAAVLRRKAAQSRSSRAAIPACSPWRRRCSRRSKGDPPWREARHRGRARRHRDAGGGGAARRAARP